MRNSTSQKSSFVLSIHAPGHLVQHHLLQVGIHSHQREGVSLLGSEKVFPSVHSLVTHLSIMRESLPCTLGLYACHRDVSEDENDEEDIIDIDSEPGLEDIIISLQKQMIM